MRWCASAWAHDSPPWPSPIEVSAPGLSSCDRLPTSCVMLRWNCSPAPPVPGLFAGAGDVLVRVLLSTAELLRSCASLGPPLDDSRRLETHDSLNLALGAGCRLKQLLCGRFIF